MTWIQMECGHAMRIPVVRVSVLMGWISHFSDWLDFLMAFSREWLGRHFQPGSKSEYLDVLYAGSGYEPIIICLHDVNKIVMAGLPGLLGADISMDSCQPVLDNRLQCTASKIDLNGFDKKCLVSRGCQKEGQFIRVNYHIYGLE